VLVESPRREGIVYVGKVLDLNPARKVEFFARPIGRMVPERASRS
jgi:hypothetical protein